jgi:hypothetical protein
VKSTIERPAEELLGNGNGEAPNRFEVLKQLDKIVASEHFRNSKRYPALLRFIVEHALSGKTDVLKERVLGTEVFGRPSDYDTNADPVVRVAAGEIRKRLAQYYRTPGHERELSIEIPLGSYVPHFVSAIAPPAPPETISNGVSAESAPVAHELPAGSNEGEQAPAATAPSPRRWIVRAIAAVVVLAFAIGLVFAGMFWERESHASPARAAGIAAFWNPIFSSESPALVVIGVHSLDSMGKDLSPSTEVSAPSPQAHESMLFSELYTDMVPVSDIVAYTQLSNLLARQSHPFRTQGASQTTFGQLQRGPVVLVGGLDNVWTIRLTSRLRYHFGPRTMAVNEIVDSKDPSSGWSFDNAQSAISNSRDYAIVASYFDPQIAQPVIVAAGIGKNGTAAATEFLTTNDRLENWLKRAGTAKGKNNIEIVLATQVVEGEQGPPEVIASYRW